MKLIPLSDFVLEQRMTSEEVNDASFQQIQDHICTYYDKVFAYTRFLKQPLTLGMFVPCDEDGNVLKEITEPNKSDYWSDNDTVFSAELYRHNLDEFKKYQKTKEKVLFEGFEMQDRSLLYNWGKIIVFTFTNGNVTFTGIDFTEEHLPYHELKTVEDLIKLHDVNLTPSALEAIGIKE